MKLPELMSTDLLFRMITQGYVNIRSHPDDESLKIFNYTDKAQYDKVWNEVTLQCRGLIVRGWAWADMEIVERPFKKFFNHGEHNLTVINLDAPAIVTDKVDGSLGILYTAPDGRPAIATRGSFTSEQALHATEVYRARYENSDFQPHHMTTYLFEIVYPENRIVLDYGEQDDLVLLGCVSKKTGKVFSGEVTQRLDRWPGPVTETLPAKSLRAALEFPPRKNAEGLVVRFGYSDLTMKVKQEDYIALHKVIFGLSEKGIWQNRVNGESQSSFIEALPDEFHGWAEKKFRDINQRFDYLWYSTWDEFFKIDTTGRMIRKEFALAVKDKRNKGLLFLCFDSDDTGLRDAIWKSLKPVGETPFKREEAAA